MERVAASSNIFRFGLFQADAQKGTLTRSGDRVKIQEQPFRLLIMLLERPGEVVTREELRQKLWPEGTFVDFDGSLNVILKRLRAAIADDPDNPRFIETVPRRGYRFIAPVSVTERASQPEYPGLPATPIAAAAAVDPLAVPGATLSGPLLPQSWLRQHPRGLLYVGSVLVFVALMIAGWLRWRTELVGLAHSRSSSRQIEMRKSVAVLGFQNLSGRAEDAWLATAVSEMLSTELAGGEKLRLISGEEVANLRASAPWPSADTLDRGTTARIGDALNGDVLVLGSYMTIGAVNREQLRLDVRMQDGRTGEILTEVAETGNTQDMFRLISRIGAQLRNRLGIEELQGSDAAGVLAALPLDPEAARFYSLGVAKLRQFDALAAKDLLEQAAEGDPKFSLVHAMLARSWAQLGYEQEHQDEAKKAFELSTDLPRAQRLLVEGEYYESLGKQEQAASVYHALFELFPDDLEYGLRLVAAQNLSGHGSQAMEVIQRLRKLPPPSSGDPRIDLAEARAMKDNKPAALVLIRTAARKASQREEKLIYALAKKEECMNLLYSGQVDQGPPACEDAYNVFLSAGNRAAAADAIRLMADGIGAKGLYEEAIASYQQALNILEGLGEHDKTGAVLNNMAINFANEGNLDRAEQLYRKAKFHFEQAGDRPNSADAMVNIADILYLKGNLPGAAKLYQQTLDFIGTIDHGDSSYALYRLADLQLTRGNVKGAEHLAQEAIDALRPTQGSYQYLTSAMIVLGETQKAQSDFAGARSQFEQTIAIRQQTGALGLVAESQVELAALAVEEGHPEQAEALVRTALHEFEKEKSDPDSSSACTVLSRALLMQSKLDEAQNAAQRAADLSLTSSDPALRLPAEIQQARVEMANSSASKSKAAVALQRLQSVITTAHRLGYYNIESEARIAMGELELKGNSSLGHKHLVALAAEMRSHGLELMARQAEGLIASGTVVAQNRTAR